MKDQQPLMKANIDMGYVISELSGGMNCLIAESIQYLHTAHIVHFINCLFGRSEGLSPLYKKLFLQVKQYGLTDEIKQTILNCKSSFCSPSMSVPREGAMLWRKHLATKGMDEKIRSSNAYYTICFVWQRFPKLMHLIEDILGFLIRLYHKTNG